MLKTSNKSQIEIIIQISRERPLLLLLLLEKNDVSDGAFSMVRVRGSILGHSINTIRTFIASCLSIVPTLWQIENQKINSRIMLKFWHKLWKLKPPSKTHLQTKISSWFWCYGARIFQIDFSPLPSSFFLIVIYRCACQILCNPHTLYRAYLHNYTYKEHKRSPGFSECLREVQGRPKFVGSFQGWASLAITSANNVLRGRFIEFSDVFCYCSGKGLVW